MKQLLRERKGSLAAPSSDASLVVGSKGDAVVFLQQTLMSLGYNVGALDGYFGDVTLEAVKAFQRDYGLYVDGVIGEQTKAALGIQ